MNNTTKNQNLPFATDEECEQLRQRLVRAGKIVPAKRVVTATATIKQIADDSDLEFGSPRRRRNAADVPEEGVYRIRKITSDKEYESRKRSYFEMLQSVLRSRIELDLEFGEHEELEGT